MQVTEFAFLAQIKNEPIALIMLAILVGYKVIDLLVIHVLPKFSKKKKTSKLTNEERLDRIEKILEEDREERKLRQAEMDEFKKEVSFNSRIAVIFNPHTPAWEVFINAIAHFKDDGNGNVREAVYKKIMEDRANIPIWKSALSHDLRTNGPCEKRIFLDSINWIEKRLA